MDTRINLADLGYDEYYESRKKEQGFTEFTSARVIAEYREAYRVKNEGGEYLARITGKQIHEAQKREDYPAVGDWVVITELPDNKAVIRAILPRKTVLTKKYSSKQEVQIIAANIDTVFIVESVDRDFNINRMERFLVLANEGGIKPVIVLNKTDLVSEEELESRISQIKTRFDDIEIISTSTVKEQGLDSISSYVSYGKTYCFLGSSGVGKSTLINKLLGRDEIKTGEINTNTERGRHTTTSREMYFLENGGIVIDNPGTREVGIADSVSGLFNVFEEISTMATGCRFSDCTHMHEPGCAVLKAVELDRLSKERYDNYLRLRKESEFYKMSEVEKKEKDRKFGKMLKKYNDMIKINEL